MQAPIHMIAVDLDGTLLNSRKRVSPRDRAALEAASERGIQVVPVTGRNFYSALPLVRDLIRDGPLIASNGAIVRSKTGETLLRVLLPRDAAGAVLRGTREYRPYTVVMYDESGEGQFRIETPANGDSPETLAPSDGIATTPWAKRYAAAIRFSASLEDALEEDPLEIMFAGPLHRMRALAERLRPDLRGPLASPVSAEAPPPQPLYRLLRTEYPSQDFSILDVIHGDCSKGQALEYWSRLRGIRPEEILAIGDNYNDLEMLRFAGWPVVMGNADDLLRQQGWPVTLDCDSDGVAAALERYVL